MVESSQFNTSLFGLLVYDPACRCEVINIALICIGLYEGTRGCDFDGTETNDCYLKRIERNPFCFHALSLTIIASLYTFDPVQPAVTIVVIFHTILSDKSVWRLWQAF